MVRQHFRGVLGWSECITQVHHAFLFGMPSGILYPQLCLLCQMLGQFQDLLFKLEGLQISKAGIRNQP